MNNTLKFKFTRNKSSLGLNLFQVFFLTIAIISLFFFFNLADWDDIQSHSLGLMLIAVLFISSVYDFYNRKTKDVSLNLEIRGNNVWTIETGEIPIDTLHFDVYAEKGKFYRYHFWDDNGQLTIFSTLEDDLSKQLLELLMDINYYEERSAVVKDKEVTVERYDKAQLIYNLSNGKYKFVMPDNSFTVTTPKVFLLDPGFKLV